MGTLTSTGSPMSELRAKIERAHQMELQLLDLIERVTQMLATRVEQKACDRDLTKSNVSLVEAALQTAGSQPLSANAIAQATGIDPAAVRMVLYSNKNLFIGEKISPRRVQWRLASEVPV